MVECFLAKEDVAGSTPVSRSKNPLPAVHFTYNSEGLQVNSPPEARYPSGKGEVCKTFMRRFDPDPRLQFLHGIGLFSKEHAHLVVVHTSGPISSSISRSSG